MLHNLGDFKYEMSNVTILWIIPLASVGNETILDLDQLLPEYFDERNSGGADLEGRTILSLTSEQSFSVKVSSAEQIPLRKPSKFSSKVVVFRRKNKPMLTLPLIM